MAYYLEYGNWSTPRYLVITTGSDGDTITTWNKLEGQRVAVLPRWDGDKKNLFTPVIKTSLEVSLFRQNSTEFNDIINGNDRDIQAFVTDGERLTADYEVPSGSTLLFKGNLTFGTWRERYAHDTPISLLFHDRIGYLAEEKFLPIVRYMSFIDILAECLINIVASDKWLIVNWLYSYTEGSTTYDYADDFYYDTATFKGKTKLQVVESLMKAHGMQLLTDFAYKVGGDVDLHYANVGAIRVRLIASQANSVNTQSIYEKKVKGVGSDLIYYYARLENSIPVTTEEVKSALYVNVDGDATGAADETVVITIKVGVDYYEIRIDAEGVDGTDGTKTYVYIDPANYNTDTIITELLFMLGSDYAFINGKITAVVGSSDWDIEVTAKDWQLTAEVIPYTPAGTTVTTGKFNEGRAERAINTDTIPLIGNSAVIELDPKAKEIVGINNYVLNSNMLYPDTISSEAAIGGLDARKKGENETTVYPFYWELYPNSTSYANIISDFVRGNIITGNCLFKSINGSPSVALRQPTARYLFNFFGGVQVYTGSGTEFTVDLTAYCTDATTAGRLYLMPIAKTANSVLYYHRADDEWKALNDNLATGKVKYIALSDGTNSLTYTFDTFLSNTPYEIWLCVFVNAPGGDPLTQQENTYITAASLKQNVVEAYPEKLIIKTNINPQNRQTVDFDAEFYNLPNIAGSQAVYRNGIYSASKTPLYTLTFAGSAQTLLFHVSDMYATEYQYNRWILQGSVQIEKFRMHDLFTLDGKSFIFVEGSYDERRGLLEGTFIEVILPQRKNNWTWLDNSDIEWQSGEVILEQ